MFENFRPLKDKVLVKRQKIKELSEGGIFIPDAAAGVHYQIGLVLATGPGRLDSTGNRVPLQVKKDDIAYFGKFSGTEIDNDHVVILEDEILFIK